MIGTLIGDLAAWTYEHDKDMFFQQLVADNGGEAKLSVYGKAFLNAACKYVLERPRQQNDLEFSPLDRDRYVGQWLMWQIMMAWTDTEDVEGVPECHALDKEEMYAKRFVFGLIRSLRNGATKSEAYYSTFSFEDLSKTWKWKTENHESNIGMLTYIFRAWDSFYRAFDYTSTIHNAVKWPGDKHLTAAIAGAFADAMYGCELSYIKNKYAKGKDLYHRIKIDAVDEQNGYQHGLIMELFKCSFRYRTFYPKNNSLTNVELHSWQPVMNVFENISFNEEEHDRILLSAPTGWECRYGMYLDDGWIYVYRSHVLIGRFQLEKLEKQWFIVNPQLSGECSFKDFCIALECAIYEGCRLQKPDIGNAARVVELCKYFNGENDVPPKWKHEIQGNFWYGEMMFCKGHHDILHWTEDGKKVQKKLKGKKLAFSKKYKPEQFGMILYIESLFAKWNPYDALGWIYEY